MFGLGGNKTLVGLDIGSSSIKAIELQRSRGQLELTHVGMEPLGADIVVDSMIVDSGSVANTIAKLFADSGMKSKDVATSVSGHSVIVKKITLPAMPDDELAETIRNEAAQHVPFDIADVNLDYQVLTDDPTAANLDVLLVAVKKDKILNYTNVLSLAGKVPAVVDVDAFALQNCYEFNYEPQSNSTVALLNFGASVLNINVVKGNATLFTRDVPAGGNQYTDALQKELDLSFDDAEDYKLGKQLGTVSDDAKKPVLQQVTEMIVLEIQKNFDFFRASSAGEHIEKIYMAGGSVGVPGLMEALRQEFSIPVEVLNPFQKIQMNGASGSEVVQNHAAQLSVAVGLALRSFEDL
jgi:type IV pilus assembly protein PilM